MTLEFFILVILKVNLYMINYLLPRAKWWWINRLIIKAVAFIFKSSKSVIFWHFKGLAMILLSDYWILAEKSYYFFVNIVNDELILLIEDCLPWTAGMSVFTPVSLSCPWCCPRPNVFFCIFRHYRIIMYIYIIFSLE